jgi:hypothetical protein
VPEIAEREPKVISVGFSHFSISYLGCGNVIFAFSGLSLLGGKFTLWAMPGLRK